MTEPSAEETQAQELYDAFTELGSDPELCDVEFAFAAQADVALRNEIPISALLGDACCKSGKCSGNSA